MLKNDENGKPLCESSKNFLDLQSSDIVNIAWECQINMWHNYAGGKNVIMTSSILRFRMTRLHKNSCFRMIFFAFV